MFAPQYFAPRYFAPKYFPPGGGDTAAKPHIATVLALQGRLTIVDPSGERSGDIVPLLIHDGRVIPLTREAVVASDTPRAGSLLAQDGRRAALGAEAKSSAVSASTGRRGRLSASGRRGSVAQEDRGSVVSKSGRRGSVKEKT